MCVRISDIFLFKIVSFDMSNSRKKKRIIFSDSQYAFMKEAFDTNPYLPRNERRKVAKTLDLSEDSVNVNAYFNLLLKSRSDQWFHYRR